MIKVNDRFSFEKDVNCWHLIESIPSVTKDGNPTTRARTTYHANIKQIAQQITDRMIDDCESLQEIIDRYREVQHILSHYLEAQHNCTLEEEMTA